MSRKTPLGQVLGLGSARDGTDHWWHQRVSAVAMVGLGLWFAFSVAALTGEGATHAAVSEWIARPFNAVLMIALVLTAMYHSQLGVQVVVEDYIHGRLKMAVLILQKFAHALLALAGVLAVVRIALGG